MRRSPPSTKPLGTPLRLCVCEVWEGMSQWKWRRTSCQPPRRRVADRTITRRVKDMTDSVSDWWLRHKTAAERYWDPGLIPTPVPWPVCLTDAHQDTDSAVIDAESHRRAGQSIHWLSTQTRHKQTAVQTHVHQKQSYQSWSYAMWATAFHQR